jgi:hypothetical protein
MSRRPFPRKAFKAFWGTAKCAKRRVIDMLMQKRVVSECIAMEDRFTAYAVPAFLGDLGALGGFNS